MYRIFGIHFSFFLFFLWPFKFLIRFFIVPDNLTNEIFIELTQKKDIIFIIHKMSLLDIFILNLALDKLNISKITTEFSANKKYTSILSMISSYKLTLLDNDDSSEIAIAKVIKEDERLKTNSLIFIPVCIFWGKSPEKTEKHFLLKMFFPNTSEVNFLQKILVFLIHGRNVFVHFANQVSCDINNIINIEDEAKKIRTKVLIEFQREKSIVLGPNLYDFSNMASHILEKTPTVKLLAKRPEGREKSRLSAIEYLKELAADYNFNTIKAVCTALDIGFNRIFSGIKVKNFEYVRDVFKKGQIIWMPCHRSHVDYMLLSYILYKKNYVAPHIAAGVNLNFWPLGAIFRKCGAFFIRRSFRGNRIYSHTFAEYVDYLMSNKYSIEFFQEGGRSRIGKLLPPVKGLLSVCVSSIISRHAEDTYFVPINFSYEKVLEDDAYAKELLGHRKQKESIWQLVYVLRKLFNNYGTADISFGKPIKFGDLWSEYFTKYINESKSLSPNLHEVPLDIDLRNRSILEFTDYLANKIHEGVNKATVVSGSSLIASAILTTNNNNNKLHEQIMNLHKIIDILKNTLKWDIATSIGMENINDFTLIYNNKSNSVTENIEIEAKFENNNIINIINSCIKWKLIETKENYYFKNPDKILQLWWYRGTIFHLIAIPSLVACFIIENITKLLTIEKLAKSFDIIRKIWREETFWPKDEKSETLVIAGLNVLEKNNIINIKNNCAIINFSSIKDLEFFSNLVKLERELYGLQLTAAKFLMKKKFKFLKNTLINTTFNIHRSAFLRSVAINNASFSKIFAKKIFDAFEKSKVYISAGGGYFKLNENDFDFIYNFFELELWEEFI